MSGHFLCCACLYAPNVLQWTYRIRRKVNSLFEHTSTCLRLVPGTPIRITQHQQDPDPSAQTPPHHHQLTLPRGWHSIPFPDANLTSSARGAELAASLHAYLFCGFIVHLERPEVEPRWELADGGEREEELLRAAQRCLGVGQLGLLDFLLLLFRGDHG